MHALCPQRPHEISQSSRGLCQSHSVVLRRSLDSSGRINLSCGVERCSQKRLADRSGSRKRSPLWAAGIATLLLMAAGVPVSAEESHVLGRMLREGQNFKVRAGAAAVIGLRRDSGHRPDLEGVLVADQHPFVRAAAADALGRIGSRASIVPLETAATKDRAPTVAVSARAALKEIEIHSASAPAPKDQSKARFGLILGEMHDTSSFKGAGFARTLGASLEKHLHSMRDVAVFGASASELERLRAAQKSGLNVYRMDATVTALSAALLDGQIFVHGEVTLLVMDPPTASIRTLLRGFARGVEVPAGDVEQQKRGIAQRVVEGAVKSALRNADTAIAADRPARPVR